VIPGPSGDEPRPRIVVSECLGFDAVRYNGQILRSRFVDALREHVEFVPLCPEMGIGLGVPRDPIRVVEGEGGRRFLIQPSTDRDLTSAMRGFAAATLEEVGARGVDGFILKSKSPSCGIRDAKIKAGPGDESPTLGRGPGLFAEAVVQAFPWAAVEDEGRLTNLKLRHHFLTKLWALARLRAAERGTVEAGEGTGVQAGERTGVQAGEGTSVRAGEGRGDAHRLVRFHTRHKLLLMAYHPERLRELGRIVAGEGDPTPTEDRVRRFSDRIAAYRELLGRTMAEPPTAGRVVNALHHAFGYVSEGLAAPERSYFLERVDRFRDGNLPLPALLAVLRSWAIRFGEEYLDAQLLLEPYPAPLFDLHSSGSGQLV